MMMEHFYLGCEIYTCVCELEMCNKISPQYSEYSGRQVAMGRSSNTNEIWSADVDLEKFRQVHWLDLVGCLCALKLFSIMFCFFHYCVSFYNPFLLHPTGYKLWTEISVQRILPKYHLFETTFDLIVFLHFSISVPNRMGVCTKFLISISRTEDLNRTCGSFLSITSQRFCSDGKV